MKRIAYITGSRAEYGIVKRLLKKLNEDPALDFSLVVTAMHLDAQYGNTVTVIEQDGFEIAARIPLTLNAENNQTIIHSMAECLDHFGAHFQQHKYDAVMVLGDRYEMLAVATAAAMHNIPLIHLHGGEQTLGNYDEFIRHCITKMSKLHLTATEEYKKRVIQLGEDPKYVYNVGSLGAENSLLLSLPSRAQLIETRQIPDSDYFMVVFHPETLTEQPVLEQVDQLLAALEQFKERYQFVFIGSNSDTSADQIFNRFQAYTAQNGYCFFTSVKPEEYLALIKYSKGLIGNSSSGLLEAPSCGVGTVNIGNRQQGRVRGETVIDVETTTEAIKAGIEKLISADFQQRLPQMTNPYYQANAMEKAYKVIKHFLNDVEKDQPKAFYDLP
ncbi:UDP-N-acetylglucosamine 2-epimerase [Actinobacillus equuli]|uniref:UDP-N-acetylglucosamine 2-epimerase n=1 Tax=Actinobacillus equuli TaxID=718 RepID=UPI0024433B0C|nr:UDP-N-acetylglucosamine 2-epimerase [Actinobacillus equuli]WGE53197.1 UDP-N-acetylglucosamine 2-epimerase [Actinobacillus equuli subsp. haemolyticus]WGE73631.1 UDP-N-acetylglucosamine 2-epimerase [Actinobacillus equuli subsp. haemolyticus]WGE75627.1 UDP-N-acetylglucosamine 2-epimerase [Actinobacillus equuli subsp. haemolyticus]WGE77523.1 UDP-N-acetylglucosamine 2-epimerase [Actinobacillus equuli subsp. haemolyticus]